VIKKSGFFILLEISKYSIDKRSSKKKIFDWEKYSIGKNIRLGKIFIA